MEAPATIPTNGRDHDIIRHTHSTIIIFFSSSNRSGSGRTDKSTPLPYCGGPLHYANYWRKPRGGPPDLQKFFDLRYSLCCGKEGCRRRVMPPSVRFWGRRVYWAPVVLLFTALRQGKNPDVTLERLKGLSGVWRSTVNRWRDYFLEIFPDSLPWLRLSGHVMIKKTNRLVHDLLFLYYQKAQEPVKAMSKCLKGLAMGP
jgi:hypothetical protein